MESPGQLPEQPTYPLGAEYIRAHRDELLRANAKRIEQWGGQAFVCVRGTAEKVLEVKVAGNMLVFQEYLAKSPPLKDEQGAVVPGDSVMVYTGFLTDAPEVSDITRPRC